MIKVIVASVCLQLSLSALAMADEVSSADTQDAATKASQDSSEAQSQAQHVDTATEGEQSVPFGGTAAAAQEEAGETLSQETVVSALRTRYRWIKGCYDSLDEAQKALVPKRITASFIIGKFGQVKRLSFKEDLDPKSGIQACFTGKLLPKRFPRPENDQAVRIHFPIQFK